MQSLDSFLVRFLPFYQDMMGETSDCYKVCLFNFLGEIDEFVNKYEPAILIFDSHSYLYPDGLDGVWYIFELTLRLCTKKQQRFSFDEWQEYLRRHNLGVNEFIFGSNYCFSVKGLFEDLNRIISKENGRFYFYGPFFDNRLF